MAMEIAVESKGGVNGDLLGVDFAHFEVVNNTTNGPLHTLLWTQVRETRKKFTFTVLAALFYRCTSRWYL